MFTIANSTRRSRVSAPSTRQENTEVPDEFETILRAHQSCGSTKLYETVSLFVEPTGINAAVFCEHLENAPNYFS